MTHSFNITELASDPEILPLEVRELLHRILDSKAGLFLFTGIPGTGTSTTLLITAYVVWQKGLPVTLMTENQDLLSQISLPQSWTTRYIGSSEQEWLDAMQQVMINSSMVIVIDQLGANNERAAFMAAEAKHWVFTSLNTPFIGIDVLYNFRSWGLATHEILDNIVGIVSQMLLPRLCDACKQLTPGSLEETRLIYPDSHEIKELWREVGCPICMNRGTGGRFRYGRCVSFEVVHLDQEARPQLEDFLDRNILSRLPIHKHLLMQNSSRNLVKNGFVGIKTYKREVLQNPLLRVQLFWEQETFRAAQLQQMFSRFVTQQLVEKLMSQQDFERTVEGERRYVTCFFCDVRGFTTRAEQSSPVEVFLTLNQYFREIIDIVFRYEGTIDKFIGDSVMVVFGAPVDQIDQELQAIQCAISIQQKVAEINQQVDTKSLQIGIGINSGEVVAGCLGNDLRMDYTVIGDVVNTAARLESRAQPGQILIGPKTYHAVKNQVKCRGVGLLKLKGKVEEIEAFEIIY